MDDIVMQSMLMASAEGADGEVAVDTATHSRHPRPDESIPGIAWPTVALLVGGVIVFALAVIAAVSWHAPAWVVIPVNSVVVFAMFLVAHEGLHRAISTKPWLNDVIGRLAWLFVLPQSALPTFGYVHGEHHRHTNDGDNDPDMAATHGPAWQLPLRWAFMDVIYATWYFRRVPGRLHRSWRRPAAELLEMSVLSVLTYSALYAAIVTGHLLTVAVVVLIPQRIGYMLIAWWFDWLPHHGLEHTSRDNRYRATRIRVGMEWLLSRLMLGQNYHLVHHLHPWLPFYRYRQVWQANEDTYLSNGAAISTVWGKPLTPQEFRDWRG